MQEIWKDIQDYEGYYQVSNLGRVKSLRCDYKYNIQYSRARKVNQYDMQGNFIKTWNCVSDIERELGIKNQMIIRCCKSMRNKTHNYIWRYADE